MVWAASTSVACDMLMVSFILPNSTPVSEHGHAGAVLASRGRPLPMENPLDPSGILGCALPGADAGPEVESSRLK